MEPPAPAAAASRQRSALQTPSVHLGYQKDQEDLQKPSPSRLASSRNSLRTLLAAVAAIRQLGKEKQRIRCCWLERRGQESTWHGKRRVWPAARGDVPCPSNLIHKGLAKKHLAIGKLQKEMGEGGEVTCRQAQKMRGATPVLIRGHSASQLQISQRNKENFRHGREKLPQTWATEDRQ